jgi:hypothetical protein
VLNTSIAYPLSKTRGSIVEKLGAKRKALLYDPTK